MINVHTHTSIHVPYKCVCIYVYIDIERPIHVCSYIYSRKLYIHVDMYISTYLYTYMSIYIYIRLFTCMDPKGSKLPTLLLSLLRVLLQELIGRPLIQTCGAPESKGP